ncbi:GNAT family N-acetyltransferase [Nocardioides pocheonensis]|uniref:GNAT family N-acetyltransferase n=1 Tax=Nocardioides pocheonensis TaxID=661485 RepID=A0A3N0GXX9_9ACTN|nr:GNAT family N-acetyltransferase [Nocardioides pocheonensis]RNM17335.1 GNAT family N-acetyltransferase [Nocardioides pocheonensis]
MSSLPLDPAPTLPEGWSARVPTVEDVPRLVELSDAHVAATRGSGGVDEDAVLVAAVGPGSWTRRQLVATDGQDEIRAWASVHDRAAGRADLRLVVDPACPEAGPLASALLEWQERVVVALGEARAVPETRIDAVVEEGDHASQEWLRAAGFAPVRRWLHKRRPVSAPEPMPPLRAGVTIRRVGVQELGDGTTMPVAEDLQAVHRMLEESFEDHFNSYRESFPEFAQRLREDPGHRWDHWWLALVEEDGVPVPGGALVSSVLPARGDGVPGTYVDYIGVHRRARGRGVAKALLSTVVADAARRGRDRVCLKVDADSPTGAADLYRSLGWRTSYATESWHKDVAVEALTS